MVDLKIARKKKTFISISIVSTVVAFLCLAYFQLNFAIDFTGGSILRYVFEGENIGKEGIVKDISNLFSENDAEASFIRFENETLVIRTREIDAEKNDELTAKVSEKYPNSFQVSFESVGSVIGEETIRKSLTALAVAFAGILAYIALAFRNIPKPYSSFKFGVSAILATVHDVVMILGCFALLGYFFNIETDVLFITALLTVIGFSVHDTIVVFDRVRENLKKHRKKHATFSQIIDISIGETLRRSLFTSLTVLLVLISLFIYGGESIKYFVLALIVGISLGTYSSVFVASPILAALTEYKKRK
jgi:preprotein translocase subunit SecF